MLQMQIAYATGRDHAASYGLPEQAPGTSAAMAVPHGLKALPSLVAGPMMAAEVMTTLAVTIAFKRMRAVGRNSRVEATSWLPEHSPEARRAFEARYGRGAK